MEDDFSYEHGGDNAIASLGGEDGSRSFLAGNLESGDAEGDEANLGNEDGPIVLHVN